MRKLSCVITKSRNSKVKKMNLTCSVKIHKVGKNLKKKRKMYLLFWLYCMSKWFELPISLNEEKWRKMGVPCECARICWRGRAEEQRHYIITH